MNAFVILGNQLFDSNLLVEKIPNKKNTIIFMREDMELCTYFRFHKHKIIFFLSAMRSFANNLVKQGYKVHYEKLTDTRTETYEERLALFIKKNKISSISFYEIEDKFFESRILKFTAQAGLTQAVFRSPMFLCSRSQFFEYLATHKKPQMKSFYEMQRKRLHILVDSNLKPEGGQWSYDKENRRSLPADIIPPTLRPCLFSPTTLEVMELVERKFANHPGLANNFWLPIDRSEALKSLEIFLNERIVSFGPYEDALPLHSDFAFHSVLAPFMNSGLLTPDEIVKHTLKVFRKRKIPISSAEGFIRQIIGWREFVRGIYQNFSELEEEKNFWNHHRKLSSRWYLGDTGVPPLDLVINKVNRYGYSHHIERLMVVGSLMLLLEVDPKEAHRWFMEMHIDSSDWVMGPNVYGMALFSDGGVFSTKPYICGSNYYRKMGPFKKGLWCDGVDGLYWQFIEKHKPFFLKNPRLSMMVRLLNKMDGSRKKHIFAEGNKLRGRLTQEG